REAPLAGSGLSHDANNSHPRGPRLRARTPGRGGACNVAATAEPAGTGAGPPRRALPPATARFMMARRLLGTVEHRPHGGRAWRTRCPIPRLVGALRG